MKKAVVAPLVLTALSYVASGFGRTSAPSISRTSQQATFRTEANYIRVDAYPTRDGVPITDLTKDDFEILEGGVRQNIEQFEQVIIRAAGPQETRSELRAAQ